MNTVMNVTNKKFRVVFTEYVEYGKDDLVHGITFNDLEIAIRFAYKDVINSSKFKLVSIREVN